GGGEATGGGAGAQGRVGGGVPSCGERTGRACCHESTSTPGRFLARPVGRWRVLRRSGKDCSRSSRGSPRRAGRLVTNFDSNRARARTCRLALWHETCQGELWERRPKPPVESTFPPDGASCPPAHGTSAGRPSACLRSFTFRFVAKGRWPCRNAQPRRIPPDQA